MAIRDYSVFYPGIKEDDFITGGANFIEGENITGLYTGYGATLGPKVSNQLRTNYMPRTIFESTYIDIHAVGTDNGEIFKLTGADYTPIYTLSNNWNILNGVTLGNYMYFISHDPVFTSAKVMRVLADRFIDETFTGADENFLNFNTVETPAVLRTGTFIYIGGLNEVYQISKLGVIVTFPIFDGWVNGITTHGTQILVYTNSGIVSYWDGVTQSVSANIELGFIPKRVTAQGSLDNILTDDGDYYQGSGYTFDIISKVRRSNRLEDNTQYINKFDFNTNEKTGQALSVARNGLYIISSDTLPGIYLKNNLVRGLSIGFHKEIIKDNAGNQFDEVGTLTYLTKGTNLSKLYFGYQSNTTNFGVDYIDLNEKTTCEDGYGVTEVFSGATSFKKQINNIRIATSYTTPTNYIKLYYRIDNGLWELLRTLSDSETIKVQQISKLTDGKALKKFIDIQFKVEFHNTTQDETPPLLHGLRLDYNEIQANGG